MVNPKQASNRSPPSESLPEYNLDHFKGVYGDTKQSNNGIYGSVHFKRQLQLMSVPSLEALLQDVIADRNFFDRIKIIERLGDLIDQIKTTLTYNNKTAFLSPQHVQKIINEVKAMKPPARGPHPRCRKRSNLSASKNVTDSKPQRPSTARPSGSRSQSKLHECHSASRMLHKAGYTSPTKSDKGKNILKECSRAINQLISPEGKSPLPVKLPNKDMSVPLRASLRREEKRIIYKETKASRLRSERRRVQATAPPSILEIHRRSVAKQPGPLSSSLNSYLGKAPTDGQPSTPVPEDTSLTSFHYDHQPSMLTRRESKRSVASLDLKKTKSGSPVAAKVSIASSRNSAQILARNMEKSKSPIKDTNSNKRVAETTSDSLQVQELQGNENIPKTVIPEDTSTDTKMEQEHPNVMEETLHDEHEESITTVTIPQSPNSLVKFRHHGSLKSASDATLLHKSKSKYYLRNCQSETSGLLQLVNSTTFIIDEELDPDYEELLNELLKFKIYAICSCSNDDEVCLSAVQSSPSILLGSSECSMACSSDYLDAIIPLQNLQSLPTFRISNSHSSISSKTTVGTTLGVNSNAESPAISGSTYYLSDCDSEDVSCIQCDCIPRLAIQVLSFLDETQTTANVGCCSSEGSQTDSRLEAYNNALETKNWLHDKDVIGFSTVIPDHLPSQDETKSVENLPAVVTENVPRPVLITTEEKNFLSALSEAFDQEDLAISGPEDESDECDNSWGYTARQHCNTRTDDNNNKLTSTKESVSDHTVENEGNENVITTTDSQSAFCASMFTTMMDILNPYMHGFGV